MKFLVKLVENLYVMGVILLVP